VIFGEFLQNNLFTYDDIVVDLTLGKADATEDDKEEQ